MGTESSFPTFRRIPRIPGAIGRGILWLWRRTWRWLAGFILVVLLVHTVANIITGRRLERELRKLKATGAPLTLTEAAPPPVPDAQNAAILYQKAFEILPTGDDEVKIVDLVSPRGLEPRIAAWERTPPAARKGQRPAQPSPEEVGRILARYGAVFSLLEAAAARPACRFPVNWEAGAAAVFPHQVHARTFARFLAAKAIVQACHRNSHEALEAIAIIFYAANDFGSEPTLISQLLRYAFQNIGVQTLREVMEIAPPSTSDARRTYETLRSIDCYGPFTHSLEGERTLGLWAFGTLRRNPAAHNLWSLDPSGRKFRWMRALARPIMFLWLPLLKLDVAYYLRHMGWVVELSHRPYIEVKDQYLALERKPAVLPKYVILTRILLPVFSRATQARDGAIANIGLAQHGMALRAYQEAVGRYPNSLAELRARIDWPLPRDPFSGKDFIYRRAAKGYLLYSIGPNMKDEGGKDRLSVRGPLPRGQQPPDDIPWRMSR